MVPIDVCGCKFDNGEEEGGSGENNDGDNNGPLQ